MQKFIQARTVVRLLASGPDSGFPAGADYASDGDVHPIGNPHYWLDSGKRQSHRRTLAAKLSRNPAKLTKRYSHLITAGLFHQSPDTEPQKRWMSIRPRLAKASR